MAKKNPYKFTIGFDRKKPSHVQAAEILNETEEKAELITKALLNYLGKGIEQEVTAMNPDSYLPMIEELIRREVHREMDQYKAASDTDKPNEEVVEIIEEEPLQLDEAMAQNISRAVRIFRNE
ncbi:hypothetical protein [Clostridium sp. C105KSO13]|uniref:hypothetical protein n=1 Tax=Clostridium sp. C105KSO13 TaxID=1776045 RepID=UPI0007406FC9|nr:hypothetical protein [Clostridium sp. C105KSO13]CUX24241.1 hypothetical protein BN3456_00719 [Clostridium sp. C105KSO13]